MHTALVSQTAPRLPKTSSVLIFVLMKTEKHVIQMQSEAGTSDAKKVSETRVNGDHVLERQIYVTGFNKLCVEVLVYTSNTVPM